MSTQTKTKETPEAQVIHLPTPNTVTLPKPEKGFHYVQVPEDITQSTIRIPIVASLCRISSGDLLAGLDEDLRELIKQVQLLGEKGHVTLKIAASAGGLKKVKIDPAITKKIPTEKAESSILYASTEGQLLVRDPDQPELDLRIIDADTPPARRVL
jgi:hypothetical protein